MYWLGDVWMWPYQSWYTKFVVQHAWCKFGWAFSLEASLRFHDFWWLLGGLRSTMVGWWYWPRVLGSIPATLVVQGITWDTKYSIKHACYEKNTIRNNRNVDSRIQDRGGRSKLGGPTTDRPVIFWRGLKSCFIVQGSIPTIILNRKLDETHEELSTWS